jgi:hypothetical protein
MHLAQGPWGKEAQLHRLAFLDSRIFVSTVGRGGIDPRDIRRQQQEDMHLDQPTAIFGRSISTGIA